jgi:hypothetical protein
MKIVLARLLFEGFTVSSMAAQVSAPNPDSAQSTPQVDPPYQRPISPGRIFPNIVDDRAGPP